MVRNAGDTDDDSSWDQFRYLIPAIFNQLVDDCRVVMANRVVTVVTEPDIGVDILQGIVSPKIADPSSNSAILG